MSDVSRALEQLDEIHTRLARTEVYRGWRSVPVAVSGVVGIAAAWWQSASADAQAGPAGPAGIDPRTWTIFWFAVAAASLAIGSAGVLWRYVREESPTERRRTEQVLLQILPALVAGACITLGLLRANVALATCLPGVWALLFSVGTFSARPYLPPAAPIVSAFYAVAGVTLLWAFAASSLPPGGMAPWFSWTVGGVFGVGQLIGAATLYWSLERDPVPVPVTGKDTING